MSKTLYEGSSGYLLIPHWQQPANHPLDFAPYLAENCDLDEEDFSWYASPIIRDRETAFEECAERNQYHIDHPPEDQADVHWWMVYELGLFDDASVIVEFENTYRRAGIGKASIKTTHAIIPVRPTAEELERYAPKNRPSRPTAKEVQKAERDFQAKIALRESGKTSKKSKPVKASA